MADNACAREADKGFPQAIPTSNSPVGTKFVLFFVNLVKVVTGELLLSTPPLRKLLLVIIFQTTYSTKRVLLADTPRLRCLED